MSAMPFALTVALTNHVRFYAPKDTCCTMGIWVIESETRFSDQKAGFRRLRY